MTELLPVVGVCLVIVAVYNLLTPVVGAAAKSLTDKKVSEPKDLHARIAKLIDDIDSAKAKSHLREAGKALYDEEVPQ